MSKKSFEEWYQMDKEQISKGMQEENIEKTNITNEEISGYSTQYISEK